jgi:hypothetical protein
MPVQSQRDDQLRDQIRLKMADDAKPKCRICHNYLFANPRCPGHIADLCDETLAALMLEAAAPFTPAPTMGSKTNRADEDEPVNNQEESILDLALDNRQFNPDIISELLSKGLLVIDNALGEGLLMFRLLFHPSALTNGVKQLLPLSISLPTPALFDAFIQHLGKHHLLPAQVLNQQPNEKISYPNGVNHFNPSPFSTRLEPKTAKKQAEENKEDVKHIRPRKPTNIALKPKGCD